MQAELLSQRDQQSVLIKNLYIKTNDEQLLRSPLSVMSEGVSPTRFALDAPRSPKSSANIVDIVITPSTPKSKGPGTRVVRWAPTNKCVEVPRLDYTAIVGDIRDATNPNYCAIGTARDLRLSSFAHDAIERAAEEWFAFLKHQARRSRRRRSAAALSAAARISEALAVA